MKPLITKLTLALMAVMTFGLLKAQSPELINYQAVARDGVTGAELSNQSIYVVLKVRAGESDGAIVYQEDHLNTETNAFGLFNIAIGGGDAITGSFAEIDWGRDTHWLEIDMDAGEGLETLGTMQFVSVPYALHAKTAENTNDADADPTNEWIDSLSLNENYTLSITQGTNIRSVELGQMMNLDDTDPTNELIDSLALSDDFTLTVGEGDNVRDLSLSSMVNFDDIDPSNELIDSLALSDDFTLTVGEGDNVRDLSLSSMVNFDDIDPTNEWIDSLALSDDFTLTIGEGDNVRDVSLGAMVNFDDIDPLNEAINDITLEEDFVLSVLEGGVTFNVDLSSMIDTTDELQTLAEVIAYSTPIGSAGNQRITDLSVPLSGNDAATKSYVDSLPLSGDVSGTPGNVIVEAIQNTPVSTIAPLNGQIMAYNGAMGEWEPVEPSTAFNQSQYFSIDIADFVGGSEDGDAEEPNRAIYDANSNSVTVDRWNESDWLYAPVHLPHEAPISEFAVYFNKLSPFYNLNARFIRQHLPTGAIEVIASITTGSSGTGGVQMLMGPIDSTGGKDIVDNSQYSYRLAVEFSIPIGLRQPSAIATFISFMGATIRCY